MFLALLIYGVNGDNREWMPRPEFNVYSWGYWFELAACFFLLNACKLLSIIKSIIKTYYKYLIIKLFYYCWNPKHYMQFIRNK